MNKNNQKIKLSRMTMDHLPAVVDVHLLTFQNFFLTFLGKNFLKVYYNAIICHKKTIKIVLVNDGKIIGFVVGTMHPSGFYSSLIKNHIFSFILASIPAVTRQPKSIVRLLRAFLKPKQADNNISSSELMSLAVLPQHQGSGYGRFLVNEFFKQCRIMGGSEVILTTDAENNEQVNAFYQKSGFVLARSFSTPERRLMNEYRYIIS